MDKREYTKKPSYVKVDNIWAEDLFEWAWETMYGAGGDGGSAIVCENPEEVFELFLIWYEKKYGKKNTWEIIRNDHGLYLTTGQDAFHITNDIKFQSAFHEYAFVVESECIFGWTPELKDKSIKPITK